MAKQSNQWPETRESLIVRVKDSEDSIAWETLLEIYRPVVYRMARGRGLQHADAEDLSQQVFVAISSAISKFKTGPDRPPFRAWLFRITRNAILNALSRRKPDRPAGSTSIRELLHAVPDNDEGNQRQLEIESQMQTTRFAAEQIRDEFSDLTWQMFWRTAVEAEPVTNIAKELEKSPGAVYMARYRVMQRLKMKVNEITDMWSHEE